MKLYYQGNFDFDFPDPPPTDAFITEYRLGFDDQDMLDAGIAPTTANKLALVVARTDESNFGNSDWDLDVGQSVSVDPVQNRITITNPRSFGTYAIGLPEGFAPFQIPTLKREGFAVLAGLFLLVGVAGAWRWLREGSGHAAHP